LLFQTAAFAWHAARPQVSASLRGLPQNGQVVLSRLITVLLLKHMF
jgi:hypothetical protein